MKRKGYKKIKFGGRIGKVFRVIFCVALVAALVSTEGTSSFFSDSETVGISISAATLDMQLRSGQPNFTPAFANNLKPNDSIARDIYIGKTDSSLPLHYGASVSKDDSCDANLFNALELQVFYNFYTGIPAEPSYHQNRTMTSVYKGNLSDFVLNGSTFDQDKLQIPNDNAHFDNKFYKENEHWFYFKISLPSDADENVQMKNCNFNFDFKAWQTTTDGTSGFSDEESIGNAISTTDWTAPEKIAQMTIFKGHNSNPENEITCSGFTNDTKIRIDWEDSTASDIDHYWFGTRTNTRHKKIDASKSHYDGDMTPGKGPYYYTVIAVDSNGNESEISEPCGNLTLDQDVPIISFDNLPSAEPLSGNFEILGSLEDATPTNYTISIRSEETGLSETLFADQTTTTTNLVLNWDTTESENGEYEVIFEATDSAGNPAITSVQVLVENQNGTGSDGDESGSDTTPPTVNISLPTDNGTISGSINIVGDVSDDNPKEYQVKIFKAESPTTEVILSTAFSIKTNLSSFTGGNIEIWDTTQVYDGEYIIELSAKDQSGNQSSVQVTVIVDNSNPAPVATEDAEDFVVVNEFLPNPEGTDSAAKPNGEWVELYNKSETETFDVNGWVLTDNNTSHRLPISAEKTLVGTTIAPKGYLVIYRDGDSDFNLNQDIDKVQLFNGNPTSADLVDSHSYTTEAPEGKSWQRIQDGEDNWVIATPTKDAKNEADSVNNSSNDSMSASTFNSLSPSPSPSTEEVSAPQVKKEAGILEEQKMVEEEKNPVILGEVVVEDDSADEVADEEETRSSMKEVSDEKKEAAKAEEDAKAEKLLAEAKAAEKKAAEEKKKEEEEKKEAEEEKKKEAAALAKQEEKELAEKAEAEEDESEE